MSDNVLVVQKMLREYGRAVRSDWSDIDGRTVLADLTYLANLLDDVEPPSDYGTERAWLGICPHGGGHWDDHCDEDCG